MTTLTPSVSVRERRERITDARAVRKFELNLVLAGALTQSSEQADANTHRL